MKMMTLLGVGAIGLYLASCAASTSDVPPGYISKDTANKMIESYVTSVAGDTLGDVAPNLKSLIIDADLLRHYLDNDEIKNVKVMFAHTLDYINKGHTGQYAGMRSDAMTIIIAGFDSEGNYVFSTSNEVPNHAVPCPRNCPDYGTASEHHLQ